MNLPRRPTYVLGAGFSKAINEAMPITHELGAALAERLFEEVVFDRQPGETFEMWLTLQVTPMPFLHSYENARRAADAARVIDEIAHVVDEQVHTASEKPAPLWLRQLIAIWHAERAVVLTFNYDTLIEQAVNATVPTTTSAEGHVTYVMGDHVVFPAPPAPQAHYSGDSGAGHTIDSFQLMKMHGSLTWYWASGDPTGSTLIRVREKHVLGASEPLATEADFSGITTLDRYLIPPITTKDGYYGSYLSNALWRMARSHISSAQSLTLIGYSLPQEDRVASQLIAQVPEDAPVAVVDRDPGQLDPPRSIIGNLANLGVSVSTATSGEEAVATFASDKVQAAIAAFPQSPAFDELEDLAVDVVVAISKGWGIRDSKELFVLAQNPETRDFEAHGIPSRFQHSKGSSYRESVLNDQQNEHLRVEDFVTASRLHELVTDRSPFTFHNPHTRETLVAIGASRLRVESLDVLEVKWAPYS